VNEVRALHDLYLQATAPDLAPSVDPIVLLAVASPDIQQNITSNPFPMQWSVIGPFDGSKITFAVQLNGKTVASGLTSTTYELDVTGQANGLATVAVSVENRMTQYPLSYATVDQVPLTTPVPLVVTVDVNILL